MKIINFGDVEEIKLPQEVPPNQHRFYSKSISRSDNSFSIYILQSVISKIMEHVNETPRIESGGILIGHPFVDINDPEFHFVITTDSVRVGSINSSIGHYTAGPNDIGRARYKIPEGLMAIGWYHSHPGHGIFLSGADMTIMKSIYSLNWQIALVVDTFSGECGFFHGERGTRTGNIYYLDSKPLCIEAIARYNCAINAKEMGDNLPLDAFRNWIKTHSFGELSHWAKEGVYQDIPLDDDMHFYKEPGINWEKEFEKAVSYYRSGRSLLAKIIFEKLITLDNDGRAKKYLNLISEREGKLEKHPRR